MSVTVYLGFAALAVLIGIAAVGLVVLFDDEGEQPERDSLRRRETA